MAASRDSHHNYCIKPAEQCCILVISKFKELVYVDD